MKLIHERYPIYYKGHPRLYVKRKPIFWWLKKWVYTRFILRELTSVAVAFYIIVLLLQIRAINQGPEAYANFQAWLKTPFSIVLHSIAFIFVIYHSITWFNLAPKAMVIHLGKNKVPGYVITGMNYAAWIIFSIGLAWILIK